LLDILDKFMFPVVLFVNAGINYSHTGSGVNVPAFMGVTDTADNVVSGRHLGDSIDKFRGNVDAFYVVGFDTVPNSGLGVFSPEGIPERGFDGWVDRLHVAPHRTVALGMATMLE